MSMSFNKFHGLGNDYVYINAIPYSMDGECMIGLAWDYASKYYERKNDGWCLKH